MMVMRKRQEAGSWKAVGNKMLRFRTRMKEVRNMRDYRCFGDKVSQARLRWFGQKSESEYLDGRMLRGGWTWQAGDLEEEQRRDLLML